MSPSLDYDAEAADLVARTLRAVAAGTDVTDRDEAVVPIASLPAPVDLGTRRSRRLPRTLVATAAAAAVLAAALVWAGRDSSAPSGTTDTTGLGSEPGVGIAVDAPPELVPASLPDGLVPQPELLVDGGLGFDTQAMVLWSPDRGDSILAAIVTRPDGMPIDSNDLSHAADALATVYGAANGSAIVTSTPGSPTGYLVLPRGDVDRADLDTVLGLLPGGLDPVRDFGYEGAWIVAPVDTSWVPTLAPTFGRAYTGGGREMDLYTVAGDMPGADVMSGVIDGAVPFPVGGAMGWRGRSGNATEPGDRTMLVWQVAPGTVGVVVVRAPLQDDVAAMVESIPTPAATPGEHPNVRLVARSEVGSDVPWALEWVDHLTAEPDYGPCVSLWIDGTALNRSCGLEVPTDANSSSFGAATQVDDTTVIYGLMAPAVAMVETDAAYPEHRRVETLPLDPDDPAGLRYVVMIIHGGRDEPQAFHLHGADGQVLETRSVDLNEVGG